jgi:creatinine amidohydrolase/Fe(II)-dependent formamide hydrolase-like protein
VEVVFEQGMTALTANGILGDPSEASAEKGETYLEALVDFFVSKL